LKRLQAFILYDCNIKKRGRSHNLELLTVDENKTRPIEVYFGFTQSNGVSNDYASAPFSTLAVVDINIASPIWTT